MATTDEAETTVAATDFECVADGQIRQETATVASPGDDPPQDGPNLARSEAGSGPWMRPPIDDGTRMARAHDAWVPLHTVTLTVCGLCLAGLGEECHTPGCLYWMASVPRVEGATLLDRMQGVGQVDGRPVTLDATVEVPPAFTLPGDPALLRRLREHIESRLVDHNERAEEATS